MEQLLLKPKHKEGNIQKGHGEATGTLYQQNEVIFHGNGQKLKAMEFNPL